MRANHGSPRTARQAHPYPRTDSRHNFIFEMFQAYPCALSRDQTRAFMAIARVPPAGWRRITSSIPVRPDGDCTAPQETLEEAKVAQGTNHDPVGPEAFRTTQYFDAYLAFLAVTAGGQAIRSRQPHGATRL